MSAVGNFMGDTLGGITGAKQQGEAAERAGQVQAAASREGIAENRRQFDALVELMQPYVGAGETALDAQRQLIGLGTPEEQQAALSSIEESPYFESLQKQGETAILQNASATGGLRGGNVQGALSQYRPQLLQQLVDQQYSRLGGLTQLGQASAAGQASAGLETGRQVAGLLGQAGAATAGGILGQGQVARTTYQDGRQIAKDIFGGMMGGGGF